MMVHLAVRAGTAEKTPHLMRRKIGDYLLSGLKPERDVLQMMRTHDALHNFSVHRKRNIYFRTLNDSWPVLIAYRMPELYGHMYKVFGRPVGQCSSNPPP